MATATAPAVTPSVTPSPAAIIPPAPSHLPVWQQREITLSGELALSTGLQLVARGVCRVVGHEGAPVFYVNSKSRPGRSHLAWVEHGRIHCDCEARTIRHRFTCSHAQFVRLLIVAESAEPRSVPAPVVAPVVAPEPEPPTPGGSSGGAGGHPTCPTCPTCGAPVTRMSLRSWANACPACASDPAHRRRCRAGRVASLRQRRPITACSATPAQQSLSPHCAARHAPAASSR